MFNSSLFVLEFSWLSATGSGATGDKRKSSKTTTTTTNKKESESGTQFACRSLAFGRLEWRARTRLLPLAARAEPEPEPEAKAAVTSRGSELLGDCCVQRNTHRHTHTTFGLVFGVFENNAAFANQTEGARQIGFSLNNHLQEQAEKSSSGSAKNKSEINSLA